MGNINNEHDVGFKYLLSAKQVFIQLLRSFVDKGWVDQIDESNVVLDNTSYILQDFQEKEADLVYYLKMKDQDIIFYMLIELQSTVDFQMPYRLLLYMVEIWRAIIKDSDGKDVKRKEFQLPVIIPIVLYNGGSQWTAPLEFKETLKHNNLFEEQLLNFKYILLDVNRYDDKVLLGLSNLVSSVFYIDKKISDNEELIEKLIAVADTLRDLSPKEFGLFKTWFKRIVLKRFPKEQHQQVEEMIDQTNPEEVEKMISNLDQSLKRIFEEGMEKSKREGMEKGMEEGMEKGIQKGIEVGIERGRKESLHEMAVKMLLKGMSINDITEITGLSFEEIEKLINQRE